MAADIFAAVCFFAAAITSVIGYYRFRDEQRNAPWSLFVAGAFMVMGLDQLVKIVWR